MTVSRLEEVGSAYAPDGAPGGPAAKPSDVVHNVNDPWRGWIGSWETEPFVYDRLCSLDIDRRVIYLGKPAMWRTDLGLISSWRDGLVFVRFGVGPTAAACNPRDLCWATLPRDGIAFPVEETYRVNPKQVGHASGSATAGSRK